jgi:hypothetical protein
MAYRTALRGPLAALLTAIGLNAPPVPALFKAFTLEAGLD